MNVCPECVNGYELAGDGSDARRCRSCSGTGIAGASPWTAPYRLPVSCPQCASGVRLVNGTSNGLLSIAIVACGACGRQWEITSRITPLQLTEAERRDRKTAA